MKKIRIFSNLLGQKFKREWQPLFSVLVLLLFLGGGYQMHANTADASIENSIEQQRQVTGKVIDESGVPLLGVNVVIEGTQTGVQTDFDGNYRINVASDAAVLVFSYIGFQSQNITVGDRTVVNVTLAEANNVLEEVVVTGYQTISKERATGSFTKIDSEQLESRPVNNVIDKLEGLSAGVNVSSSGKVEIRGVGTMLAGSDPLYVIDGFPVSIPSHFTSSRGALASINPEDIESVTILKDASAASIWGVRASNGVIVITTKKGKNDGKLRVELSSYLTVEEEIDYSKQDLMSTSDVMDMHLEAHDKGWFALSNLVSRRRGLGLVTEAQVLRDGLAPNGDVWSNAQYNNYITDLRGRDNLSQWEEHLLRQPIRQTYNLSVSGGSDKNNFYASMVYNDNLDHSIGNSNDRIIMNIQDTYRFNENFGFTAGITATLRNQRSNGVSASNALWVSPWEDLVDENGETIQYYTSWNRWTSMEREAITGLSYSTNQLDTQRATDQSSITFDVRAKFGIDYNILDNLKFTSSFQYEKGSYNWNDYEGMDLPSQRILINNMWNDDEDKSEIPLGSTYRYTKRNYRSWDFRNTLTWDQSWDKHELNVFVGTEIIRRFSDYMADKKYGFNQQTNTYVPVNQADLQGGTVFNWFGDRFYDSYYSKTDADDREFSVFSNIGYEFNDKYALNASFRIDQKNLFGSDPDFRYKPLWSAGLGWNMAKEDFMANVDIVDRLRLRATYGLSGNANNRYSPFAQARNFVYSWGANLYDLLRLTQPANDKLKWEETTTFNLAADFALFGNKLNGSIEYYKRWSDDLLGSRKLDVTNGFRTAVINYASMENSGIELDLSAPVLHRGDFGWDANFNFSYNKNEVTEIEDQLQTPATLSWSGKLGVGFPYNNLMSYNYAGLDAYGNPTVVVGGEVVSWRDAQADIAEEDMIYHGESVAPIYGGLRNSFRYKDFDLGINITYKMGHVFSRNTGYGSYYGAYGDHVHKSWVNRWKQPGDEANTRMPKIAYEGLNPQSGDFESHWDNLDGDRFYVYSQDHIYDADFIRVRDINLGYTMPKSILDKTFIQSVRFTAQVQNPFLWTKNDEGYDPEAAYRMAYDNLKTFTFGVKATF